MVLLSVLFVPVLRDRINAYFVVEPTDPVMLHAPINGKVEAVYVHEGDTVQRGQLLLTMSSTGRREHDIEFAGGGRLSRRNLEDGRLARQLRKKQLRDGQGSWRTTRRHPWQSTRPLTGSL